MAQAGERLRARALERREEAVYRYALGVLGDAREAGEVVSATLAAARAFSSRRRLVDTAHGLCRELVEAELGPAALAEDERSEATAPTGDGPCAAAELAVSRAHDGRLSRAERAELAAHLA